MANEVDTSKTPSETRQMNGRRVIKSSVRRITRQFRHWKRNMRRLMQFMQKVFCVI